MPTSVHRCRSRVGDACSWPDRRQSHRLDATAAAAPASRPTAPFVSADFNIPRLVEAAGFKLVPLGPGITRWTSISPPTSLPIEHLQQTFTRSTAWPHKDLSAADAMRDMETEQARLVGKSFAYAVLTPDGRRERGCVYVYPSTVEGYDAVVTLWVTKAEYDAGFDAELCSSLGLPTGFRSGGRSGKSPIPDAPSIGQPGIR